MSTPYQALALLSTGIYFTGLAHAKLAAADMRVLRGHRPLQLAGALLSDPRWLTGAAVLAVGATLQVVALTGLGVADAQPMFLAGLAILLVLSLAAMGERLTLRNGAASSSSPPPRWSSRTPPARARPDRPVPTPRPHRSSSRSPSRPS